MTSTILIFSILAALIFSAFFSGCESGLYFINRDKLKIHAAQGDSLAASILRMIKAPTEMIHVTLICNNAVLQWATYSMTALLMAHHWNHPWLNAEITTSLILFLPFFIFGEVMPKAMFRLHAYPLMLHCYPLLQFFKISFRPLTLLLSGLNSFLELLLPRRQQSHVMESFGRHELSMLFAHAFAGGVLSQDQIESINQALNVSQVPVEQLMTPIRRAPLVSKNDPVESLYSGQPPHRQGPFPIYNIKKTNIVGLVDLRHVALQKDYRGKMISELMHQVHYVEKGQPFVAAIEQFALHKVPMLFVRSGSLTIGYLTREEAMTRMIL